MIQEISVIHTPRPAGVRDGMKWNRRHKQMTKHRTAHSTYESEHTGKGNHSPVSTARAAAAIATGAATAAAAAAVIAVAVAVAVAVAAVIVPVIPPVIPPVVPPVVTTIAVWAGTPAARGARASGWRRRANARGVLTVGSHCLSGSVLGLKYVRFVSSGVHRADKARLHE